MDGNAQQLPGGDDGWSEVRQESNPQRGNSPADRGDTSDTSKGTESTETATSPRDLLSARHFPRAAKLWRDKGWVGTIPLPAKAKNPPPTGWTGRNASFPDNEQISEWCRLAQYKRGNIGLHLGWPIKISDANSHGIKAGIYEVIGIDVDDYEDNGKIKKGAQQLRALESQFGSLPRTYVSTARASRGDFNSGIRFYLVPSGLAFRGQVDKDIEVIQKSHRFAVVWPSYNPKSDSQYCLYSPDEFFGPGSPAGDRTPTPLHEIPHVTELPLLPDKWIDYLTNGRMADADGGIDMESSVDEIEEWAAQQFNDETDMCAYTRKVVKKWKRLIKDEATSHDKVRDAHWEIVNCAAEGHTGWLTAIAEIDKHWIDDVMARSKRGVGEMRREMWRSKINALRKVKVKVENATSAGGLYTPAECVCAARASITAAGGPGGTAGGLFIGDTDTDSAPPDGLENVSWGHTNDPNEYALNDDGNGEFLCDLLRYKSGRVKWAEGYGWILWTDSSPDRPARWVHDENGLIRRAFWRVKRHQELFAEQKHTEAEQLWAQAGGVTPMPALVKARFAEAKAFKAWAIKSGNNSQAEAAIRAATRFPGVTIDINELNQNPYLLGVSNGVVELRTNGAFLRHASPEDFVTYNTGVPWHGDYSGISAHDPGKKMWEEYLNRFIPETRRRDYQTILGHTIIGGNPERLILVLNGGTSTGKSTMLRAIGSALGDYATTANLTIFENHKLNPALANALPKRVVFTSELSAGDKLLVAMVKRMTGNDVVKAELKGVNVEVSGVPQFIPIMATNTPPEIVGADKALSRRLLVLPFDQPIEDRKDEKRAAEQLEEHAGEAILAWLIEGYNIYCRQGIPSNLEVNEATKDFASQLDPVSEFMSDRIREASQDDKVAVNEMFDAYQRWAESVDLHRNDRLNQNQFSRRLTGLGLSKKVVKIDGKATKAWIGVRLIRVSRSRSTSLKMVTESQAASGTDDGKSSGSNKKSITNSQEQE